MTRTRAAEFVGSGVRVNTVSPGPTQAPKVTEQMDPELVAQTASSTLLRRQATPLPREIAEVILFLALDRSSYMTGASVAADAGRTVA